LLLTPTTREEIVNLEKFKQRMEKYPNGTTMPNLATQVFQMLPTPTLQEYTNSTLPPSQIKRQNIAKILNTGLSNLPHLKIPKVLKENTHSYYIYPMNIDVKKIGVSRKKIVNKLKKSGVPGLAEGYVNIHKLPMYKKKIAYGINNFPWKSVFNKKIYNLINLNNFMIFIFKIAKILISYF
jgi:hypothetical protein